MKRLAPALMAMALLAGVVTTAPAHAAEDEDVEDVRLNRYISVRTDRTAAVTVALEKGILRLDR